MARLTTLARRQNLRLVSGAGLCALGATAFSGCTIGAGPNHNGNDAPVASGVDNRLGNREPLALVLSSGGPRGFVHIGVIQALDEMGIRPDMVVGASIGALVGALYCGGLSGNALRQIAIDLGPTQFARLAIGAAERYNGAPIAYQVNSRVDHRQLQQLNPVCAVVAQKQQSRELVAFTRGNAGIAVQASTAIEGRFTPVTIRSQAYVDPDKTMPLPVRIARRLGAARVLSVDASAHETKAPPGAERFYESDRVKRRLTEPDARSADLNLHPYFGYWVSISQEFRLRSMRAGYEAAMQAAGQIRKLRRTPTAPA